MSYTHIEISSVAEGIELYNETGNHAALVQAAALASKEANNRHRVDQPAAAVAYMVEKFAGFDKSQENLYVMCLNTRNEVLKVVKVYTGTLNSSPVRMAELVRPAVLEKRCAAVILCHNHPSGDPTPSPNDVTVTRAAKEAFDLMDLQLLDHVVIGNGYRFESIRERFGLS